MVPIISVVTPSFNQGQYLEQAIDSVLSQNYPKLEYIIIDGGSTDNSLATIKKYKKYLTYWQSKPDKGQSDAINKGLKIASGQIASWLNSDDYYLSGCFNIVANSYWKNSKASFYYGNGLRVDENGKIKEKFFKNGTVVFDLTALIFGLNYILQPSTFINNSWLKKINYLDPDLKYGMDSDLWIRLAKMAMPEPIGNCLAASREYGDTKTSSGSFERIEELRKIAERHSGCPITPGALLYFLDALYKYVRLGDNFFPSSFERKIVKFSKSASSLLKKLNLGKDGIPVDVVDKDKSYPAEF